MTFSRKIIELDIQLVKKNFQSGESKVKITGLPISVKIEKVGLPGFNTCSISIRGLSLDRMEALASIGVEVLKEGRHKVQVWAGDAENGLSLIYVGDIKEAFADFNGAPDIEMRLNCITGYYDVLYAQPPIAVKGETKAADLVEALAKSIGYTFTNKGVDSKVKDVHISGDTRTKMYKIANQVGASLIIDDNNVILTARGKVHKETSTVINQEKWLVGYPVVATDGVTATSHFNPSLFIGSSFKLESIVPRASGEYKVMRLTHSLTANDPDGGDWFTTIEGKFYYGYNV